MFLADEERSIQWRLQLEGRERGREERERGEREGEGSERERKTINKQINKFLYRL